MLMGTGVARGRRAVRRVFMALLHLPWSFLDLKIQWRLGAHLMEAPIRFSFLPIYANERKSSPSGRFD